MITKELIVKLKKIRLLAMDVDGTLTDSAMYYSENGEELKRFSTRDGMGISLINKTGIKTALITSENSQIVIARSQKLNIENVFLDCHNKTKALGELCLKYSINFENIAYIGDDVNDITALCKVGFGACPNDASDEVKKVVDYICDKNGGNGAVRELIEHILRTQGYPVILEENW